MAKAVRGVFEHPVDSGVWWINFYYAGKRHREKVGRRSDAVALYQKRKTEAQAAFKLPETLRVTKAVLFEDLAKDAMLYSSAHKRSHRGDLCNLNSILPVFGKLLNEKALRALRECAGRRSLEDQARLSQPLWGTDGQPEGLAQASDEGCGYRATCL